MALLYARVTAGKFAELFTKVRRSMSHPDIHALAQQWLAEALEELEEHLSEGNGYPEEEEEAYSSALTDALESTELELRSNNFSKVKEEVDGLLTSEALRATDLPKELYRRLCREVLKAKQTYLREAIERLEGRYPSSRYRSNDVSTSLTSPVQKKAPSPRLSLVIPEYLKAFERRAPGTLLAKKTVFKRVLSIIGDTPLSSISERDLLRYRETVALLPTNMTKRYPGKTVPEVLKAIQGKAVDRISLATINMDLTHLSHFFGWSMAKPRRYLQENPVEGLFYEDVEAESYEPFTDEDLQALFLSDDSEVG